MWCLCYSLHVCFFRVLATLKSANSVAWSSMVLVFGHISHSWTLWKLTYAPKTVERNPPLTTKSAVGDYLLCGSWTYSGPTDILRLALLAISGFRLWHCSCWNCLCSCWDSDQFNGSIGLGRLFNCKSRRNQVFRLHGGIVSILMSVLIFVLSACILKCFANFSNIFFSVM